MKKIISLVIGPLLVIGLIILIFTFQQAQKQEIALKNDLQYRTSLLADSFKESIRAPYLDNATSTVQRVLDKFAGRERLLGIAVYDNKGEPVAMSVGLPQDLVTIEDLPERAMDSDNVQSDFLSIGDTRVYVLASPLRQDGKIIGALSVFQRADYVDDAISEIWKTNISRLLLQIVLFTIAIVVVFYVIIYRSIVHFAEIMRQARSGKTGEDSVIQGSSRFFKPIAYEISKMTRSLRLARNSASEEARMRLQELDSPWTAERLKEFFKAYFKDRQIFVVSNREPYIHKKNKDQINWVVPPSGMVTALEPIMEACGGLWLAHGSGDADKETVNEHNKIEVPPDEPKYTLKRIWLTEKEVKGYYVGFSNEALWPLCHLSHTRPIFRKEDWIAYRKVNGKFAESLLDEIKDVQRPIILVQDYHFALLPKMIKKSRPDAEVGLFWHIPWPGAETFSICPWRKEILKGMLGADVLGFHTQQYCNNFMETVAKELESLSDLEKFCVTHEGHTTIIKPFPISVAFTNGESGESDRRVSKILEELKLKTKMLGVGVDRLDYTKGILERLKGLEFFFTTHPTYKGQFTFLQIAPPSREGVEKYQTFNDEVTREAERINEKLETGSWKPIILLKKQYTHEEIYALYRAAHVCLVTSLSDGMNLVAKEFVSARDDELGVLILSQFTGAAKDLIGSITINPYSAEETAEALYKAITMAPSEQHRRMRKMRESVKDYNVYRWAAEFLKAINRLEL